MAATARPRRSVLYMPGSNSRALEKARTLAADGLILDLEDAVAPDAKAEARANVAAAVDQGYGRREVLVRINGLNTPWGYADLEAVAASGCDGILLPKVESADTVRQVETLMAAMGAPEPTRIWCMMETPLGILRAEEIAGASARLGGFVMGTSDLAKDLHCHHTPLRLPMITGLGLCLLAARAHGLAILDGVFLDLSDADGFAAACQQGLELGFDGKTLIHPKTIAAANEVFAPGEAEVTWSRRIIEAHAEAEKAGQGVVVVDGKLVENLHVVNARRLVALAEAIAVLEADMLAAESA
ncbi:HpcH/HpaI aldolase/citrate lyase family protein [Roseospira visakhapatnamensis]|uniref:Citrate lyase subunit beta/citryl-CoA lyase n=1 Tax=Roseospira visakhapatnamensis TaxID=390880 RepID=A0A7W6RHE1_9PROT|nr:CoA ester lyase [Roseospira visakhapatnamensis]MBB4268064.1 citrate lyase subunit beta/citryl-CoA lyase [Roseospira visakhapatnamensis]